MLNPQEIELLRKMAYAPSSIACGALTPAEVRLCAVLHRRGLLYRIRRRTGVEYGLDAGDIKAWASQADIEAVLASCPEVFDNKLWLKEAR